MKRETYPSQVGVRQLRQELALWLDRVRSGEEIVVTEHGKPIARIVPASLPPGYQRLIDLGILHPPKAPKRPSSTFRTFPVEGSVTELLLKMRGR